MVGLVDGQRSAVGALIGKTGCGTAGILLVVPRERHRRYDGSCGVVHRRNDRARVIHGKASRADDLRHESP